MVTENLYLFLDESGDLGFDWTKKGTTPYFIITLLVCYDENTVKKIKSAVQKTLKNKVNHKKNKTRIMQELKGGSIELPIKKYFFMHLPAEGWGIYAITLDKRNIYPHLQSKAGKQKLYNFLSKFLISKINIPETLKSISLVMDRCKKIDDINDCNNYLRNEIFRILPSIKTVFDVTHEMSHKNHLLQAADLFCWGIFRKMMQNDSSWYEVFKKKVVFEEVYWPE
ncbi:MAG: DUF3800 domain-containing protein [Legionellales bacterium]|nr:DUF3800 domain-containing protein [Legionellales bacterium]